MEKTYRFPSTTWSQLLYKVYFHTVIKDKRVKQTPMILLNCIIVATAHHEYGDGNATTEAITWNPQGHSGMFEVGYSSQHAHIQASYADDHDGVDVGSPAMVDWGTIAAVDVGSPTIADEGVWGITVADGDALVPAIGDGDAIFTHKIGSYVEDVMREYLGFHTELPSLDPSPTPAAAGRWLERPEWLRIRTVIRCALFIRQAAALNNNSFTSP